LGNTNKRSDDAAIQAGPDAVVSSIRKVNGVNSVSESNGMLHIECSHDITSDIAAAVISTGAQMMSLNMKQYGLDDIYYRYFEGGVNHE